MEKDRKSIWLVAILIILIVLIVGLIIGLVVVNMNNKVVEPSDEISHEELANGENDTNNNISTNISEIYYQGDKDKALALFDREIGEAMKDGDYERYIYLASSKSNVLISDNRCGDALSFYDSIDMNGLPAEYEANIYIGAITAAKTCENDKSKDYYEEKLNALMKEEDLGVEDGIGE